MQSPWNTLLDHWCHEVQIYYVSQRGCTLAICCFLLHGHSVYWWKVTVSQLRICCICCIYAVFGWRIHLKYSSVCYSTSELTTVEWWVSFGASNTQVMNNVSINSSHIAQSQNTSVKICWHQSHIWLLLFHQVDVENSEVMSKLLGAGAVVVGQLWLTSYVTYSYHWHFSLTLQ